MKRRIHRISAVDAPPAWSSMPSTMFVVSPSDANASLEVETRAMKIWRSVEQAMLAAEREKCRQKEEMRRYSPLDEMEEASI